MDKEILPKVKIIINQAKKEAKSFDDIKLKPEHIILSMLTDDDNSCVRILKKLKIDTSDLHDRITDFLRKSDLTPRVSTNDKLGIPYSDETKKVFNAVDKECDKMNDAVIDTIHIMLAILATKMPISKFLSDMGINYNNFKNTIMGINDGIDDEEFADDFLDEQENLKKVKKKTEITKTPVLDNFCRDITKAAEKGLIDPVVGRANEIKRISQILSRRKKITQY